MLRQRILATWAACLVVRGGCLRFGGRARLFQRWTEATTTMKDQQTVIEHIEENVARPSEVVVDAASTVSECVATIRAARRVSGEDRVAEVGRVWVRDAAGKYVGHVGASDLLLAEDDRVIARGTRNGDRESRNPVRPPRMR